MNILKKIYIYIHIYVKLKKTLGEACFFDNSIPLETVVTTNLLINYFVKNVPLDPERLVIVAPNSECVSKARKFQVGFSKAFNTDVKMATFFSTDTTSGPNNIDKLSLLTDTTNMVGMKGVDVVVVDDMVDTAGTLSKLTSRLKNAGAKRVYVCASHGLFSEEGMSTIESSSVDKVVVTNTLPLPLNASSKVIQVSVAPMLADVILAEHFRTQSYDDDDISEVTKAEEF